SGVGNGCLHCTASLFWTCLEQLCKTTLPTVLADNGYCAAVTSDLPGCTGGVDAAQSVCSDTAHPCGGGHPCNHLGTESRGTSQGLGKRSDTCQLSGWTRHVPSMR